MIKIGCLHAHYSNIAYIEQALARYEAGLLHFVDPALVSRVSADRQFTEEQARSKVKEQMIWIAESGVDAILLTCTNYIALLDEEELSISLPIIKIDEPFFEMICNRAGHQAVVFTNPATVEGTLERLHGYARSKGKSPSVDVHVIDNAFELVLQGKQKEYVQSIQSYTGQLLQSNPGITVSFAQLSMSDAAEEISRESGVEIGHPLKQLAAHIADVLGLHQ